LIQVEKLLLKIYRICKLILMKIIMGLILIHKINNLMVITMKRILVNRICFYHLMMILYKKIKNCGYQIHLQRIEYKLIRITKNYLIKKSFIN
jgi:hypothetical protein